MNNNEEARLCKKCGKRLPSSNNFCMYCGYNNNLNDDELEALKSINSNNIHTQNKQELLNKSIAAKDRDLVIGGKSSTVSDEVSEDDTKEERIKHVNKSNSLMNKLLYVFIILDVILVSCIFIFKSDGLLFEKFKYDLDGYDKLIYLEENSFLGLKNNSITVIGEDDELNKIDFKKINSENVIGMDVEEDYSNNIIYIETNKKMYTLKSFGSTYSLYDTTIKNKSDNFYKDLNTQILDKTNTNGDYYNILDENYFIKDNSLYKNVRDKKNDSDYDWYYKYSSYYDSSTYHSELVLKNLDMDNPEILDNSSKNSVIIKDNNKINVYFNDKLIQSIKTIKSHGSTYNISDFKYVLYKNNRFTFVRDNGAPINYYYHSSFINFANIYGINSKEFKSRYGNDLNEVVDVDKASSETTLSSTMTTNFSIMALFKNMSFKVVCILLLGLIAIGAFFFEVYKFRESSFIISTLCTTAYLEIAYAIIQIAIVTILGLTEGFDFLEFMKSLLTSIPGLFIVSWIITQIRSIVNYITFKLNIETIYHFILLFIGVFSFLLAVSLLTNNVIFIIVLPGLVYVYMTLNDESYVEDNYNTTMFIKIISTLLLSLVIGFILCNVLNLCEYYLFILVVAFALSCFIVMYEKTDILSYLKKSLLSFSSLFLAIVFVMIGGIIQIFSFIGKGGFNGIGELFKIYFGATSIFALYIAILSAFIGLLLFVISKISKNIIDKLDNRTFKIFIYMIIMVIILVIFILVLPYINQLIFKLIGKLFDISSYLDTFNLFSII